MFHVSVIICLEYYILLYTLRKVKLRRKLQFIQKMTAKMISGTRHHEHVHILVH